MVLVASTAGGAGGAAQRGAGRGSGWVVDRARVETAVPQGFLTVRGLGDYRGALELVRAGSGLAVVNDVGLEDYVRGVAEVPSGWPMEALRAQAIAARPMRCTRWGARSPARPAQVHTSVPLRRARCTWAWPRNGTRAESDGRRRWSRRGARSCSGGDGRSGPCTRAVPPFRGPGPPPHRLHRLVPRPNRRRRLRLRPAPLRPAPLRPERRHRHSRRRPPRRRRRKHQDRRRLPPVPAVARPGVGGFSATGWA